MGGSAPKAPDPVATAGAQTGQNVGTAVANHMLGYGTQTTPYGTQTTSAGAAQPWTDPISGKTYQLPSTNVTSTLSPAQQQLQDQQTRASTNTSKLAADQSQRLGSILGKPINLNGAPGVSAPQLGQVGPGPNMQSDFGGAGHITKTYGDAVGYEGARSKVEDALMSRINPSLDQERSRMTTQLANQGIKQGTSAYGDAMKTLGQQANDAHYGAILNAGQEQSRLAGLDQNRAQFQNSAQQQGYNQSLGRATFGNEARQQMYQNQAGATGINNATAQQGFQNQQGMRSNYLQEQYANRNQPINEIAALLGTGQVQQPQFQGAASGGVPTTDFAGMVQNNYKNKLAQQQQGNPMMGGLFGLLNTGLGAVL